MNNHIGKNVKIGLKANLWHFTYIRDNTEIGERTSIGSLTHIDRDVIIGSDCRIQGMVYIPPDTVIKNRVFIGPGVVFTNDPFPPSGRLMGGIESDTIICASAVIKAGVTLGAGSVIGMGSVVTSDVEPSSLVYGVPATERYSLEEYKEKQRVWIKGIG